MRKSSLVVQSNLIIESRYRLTREEQKLLKILISTIDKNDKDFHECQFSIRELSEFMDIRIDGAYSFFDDLTTRLHSRYIEIRNDEKNKFEKYNWVVASKYDGEKGKIKLTLNHELKEFLLELRSHFTKYELENVMALNNTYAIRFYEIGKKNIGLKKYESYVDLKDLREMLKLKKSQYKTMNNFKKFILDVPKEEINKHTDITFEYESVKRGRGGKVVGYNLTFKPKKNAINSPAPESVTEFLDQLKAIGITTVRPTTAQKWLDDYGMDKLKVAIEVAQETHAKGKKVGAGLIAKALKEGWTGEAEKVRQEQEAIRAKQSEQIAREKAKTRVQGLYEKYTQQTTKIVQKWHDGLSEADQEGIKSQYESQNSIFGKKASTDSAFYQAHLSKLYKEQYPIEGFGAWLDKHTKKKKIKMTQPMLLAVAELDKG